MAGMDVPLYNLSPLAWLVLMGALIALGPVLWVVLRGRQQPLAGRLRQLTWITLFLTFDLILFGSFTRLTDSGLGCPDWPGCYGYASPVGARAHIEAAQTAMPSGPVTHGKAWIEMVHRYLASGVGALCVLLAAGGWWLRRQRLQGVASPWWATASAVWVCVQGAFGALTVTMKLFPAIVVMHLLGGYLLLGLLTIQALRWNQAQHGGVLVLLPQGLRWGLVAVTGLVLLQAASGAWVSTNYAVLACSDFPTCHGSFWPDMAWSEAFAIWRPLGMHADGTVLTFQALTAIHFTHRLSAVLVMVALLALVWRLWRYTGLRRPVQLIVLLLTLQLATGVSNVVLGWPLLAAVLHTGGAGALFAVMVWLLGRTAAARHR